MPVNDTADDVLGLRRAEEAPPPHCTSGTVLQRVAVKELNSIADQREAILVQREEEALRYLAGRPYSVKLFGPARHIGNSTFLVMR